MKPEVVCEVRYLEWTHDWHLRAPVFIALREDKPAKEVVIENAGRSGSAHAPKIRPEISQVSS